MQRRKFATTATLLFLFLVFFLFPSGEVAAQGATDEVLVGPITTTNDVNGVRVNIEIASYFHVVSKADGLHLDARIEGNLENLQAKFGSIVDTFPLPKGNCDSYKPDNLVV